MNPIVRLRAAVLTACGLIIAGTFLWTMAREPYASLRIASLTQDFGLQGTFFLYLTLLITPLSQVVPPAWRAILVPARRPLGVAAFFASLLHTAIGFWGELGGFAGIPFLTSDYKISLLLTTVALLIMLALAATSFDKTIAALGAVKWKWLHRLIYVAGYLIILHVLKLGSHYSSVTPIFRTSFVLFGFLGVLEALRIDRYLQRTQFRAIGFGVVSLLMAGFLALQLGAIGSGTSLSLHAEHGVPTPAPVAGVHYHANFLLYVNGAAYDFSPDKYMEPVSICSVNPAHPSPQARVHMHQNDGTLVHVHSANVTWGDLFSNLGFAINAASIVTDTGTSFAADSIHPLVFRVNGDPVTNIAGRYIDPNDRLLIDFGSTSATDVQVHAAKVPATAAAQSEHNDPATCSGS